MTAPELRRPGLWDLDGVALPAEQAGWLDRIAPDLQGAPAWRRRKLAEVRDLFALAAIAPRLTVLAVDPRTTLLALLALRVPVPCRAAGAGELTIAGEARLVLRYPEEALRLPLPGAAFVEIESPRDVYHANVGGPAGRQLLCLGASIAPGTPARELVLASYQALCMAAYHLDPGAGAGVMNAAAAAWWANHLDRVPLSREPFLPAAATPAPRTVDTPVDPGGGS